MSTQTAIFAAGCFWGVEHNFRKLEGVSEAVSGYIGGHTDNPTYKDICNGDTGHAEAVEVHFDSSAISFEELLQAFWAMHDPTQKDRQGPDVGRQYRSAVFYVNDAQKESAIASKQALEDKKILAQPIATEITAASKFWPAEEYHQRYIEKNGGGHCAL
jgi:peptide-methionine (S)-S-oxide reductase